MMLLKCFPYVIKQITRNRVRSVLTVMGIAIAMFLFTSVQAMKGGAADFLTKPVRREQLEETLSHLEDLPLEPG